MYPFLFFRLPFNFFSKLMRHKGLIKSMVLRDLKSRYVGSAMGLFWSVIHPLVLLASYTFVFSVVLKQPLGTVKSNVHRAVNALREALSNSRRGGAMARQEVVS